MKYAFLLFSLSLILSSFAAQEAYLAPMKVLSHEDNLYVLGAGNSQLLELDKASLELKRKLYLSQTPSDMHLLNGELYITTASAEGEVLRIELSDLSISQRINAGHTPMAPVLSADKKSLYICNRFNDEVAVYRSGQKVKSIAVPREPVAAVRRADTLLVANHLSAYPANAAYTGCELSLIDMKKNKLIKNIKLKDGTTGLRGLTLSSNKKYAYMTSVLARHRVPAMQIERGWVSTNALSIVDLEKQELFATVLLDDLSLGAANPWAIEVSQGQIFISLAGTHDLMVIDEEKILKAISGLGAQEREALSNDLNFMNPLKKRIALESRGVRSLCLDEKNIWLAGYFSDSIEAIDIEALTKTSFTKLMKSPIDQQRLGEELFNDASFCFQKWMSCATCHPDTRTDALNWDLGNDGFGSFRNVKNMLFTFQTPPTTVTACRANATVSVRAGVGFFMAVLPVEKMAQLDAYLKNMMPIPSPALVKSKLSEAALRGREIFNNEADCASCHSGEYFTDMKRHRVGTGLGRELKMKFDVPTLREVWRTAPYLHDGRAKTLKEVFTIFNPEDKHGDTSGLSKKELNELIEYVKSL